MTATTIILWYLIFILLNKHDLSEDALHFGVKSIICINVEKKVCVHEIDVIKLM